MRRLGLVMLVVVAVGMLGAQVATRPATKPTPPGGFGSGGGEIKGDPATGTHPFIPAVAGDSK